ncbi:hypothetical protein LOTGIDRAFT_236769 [Lottia gigantea]|uniref:Mitochondrial import receptor subunit TOM70 n=1 Tax=Lottia gigantea TaxID=225164 RepID=V4B420_LOTGI|nr:hypothetical protein LOTGIDRAFT_236769 [Lottia gigantea]ESO83169.1 hypothetical protein LOTGIDRAFT_236769 [Lottia gigantea]
MPLWNIDQSDINLGLSLAAGIGIGVAGTYLIQKLVRNVQGDDQKDKKPVNVVKPTADIWKHVDIYSGAEMPMDTARELPPIKLEDTGPPPSTIMAECFKQAGDKLRKQKNYLEAIAAYTDGADCCPAEERFLKAKIYRSRASAYQEMGDRENIIKDCTLSLAQYNGDQDVYSRRAAAYMHFGKLQEALGDYATIAYIVRFPEISLQGRIQEITEELARVRTAELWGLHTHPPPPKYVVDEFLERFHNHPLKVVDGTPASRNFFSLKQAGPSAEVDYKDRALVQAQREFLAGNILAALHLEEKQITDSTNPEKYMLLKATALFLFGSSNDAIGLLLQIEIKPNMDPLLSATILIQTASLLYWVLIPAQAQVCFDRAVALVPDNTDVFFHRGEEYFKLGDYLKAIENYNQALRFKTDSIPAMTALALALFRQANESDAHFKFKHEGDVLFQEMLERHPNHYLVHFTYAKVLTNRRNYQEAEEHYDIAHRLAPHIGQILTHKAEMYLMVDRKIKALESLEKALQIDPSCVKAYEKIGYMQTERNLVSKAMKMFETGIKYAMDSRDFFDLYAMYFTAKSKVCVAVNLGIPISIDDSDAKRLSPIYK